MKNQPVTRALAIYILISLQGCATRIPATGPGQLTAADIPEANPALDHYIAWVPRDSAQTSAVAMAQAHISMGYAKEQAERQLCGDDRLMDETVTERIGPLATIAPEKLGGYPAWYYRISQKPGLIGCGRVGPQRIYQAIKESLPVWIRLETAASSTPETAKLLE